MASVSSQVAIVFPSVSSLPQRICVGDQLTRQTGRVPQPLSEAADRSLMMLTKAGLLAER
jgi:hypothetical protein